MTDYKLAEIVIVDSDGEEIADGERDLTEYEYVSNGIRFTYYIGYEIAALLGYKNTNNAVRNNVSKYNQLPFKEYPGVRNPPIDPRAILITQDGAVELLLKTRKRVSPDVLHLLKKFGIRTTNRKCLTKEQQTLSALANAFKTELFEDQYKVGKYFIDLYFTEYRLCIECDENGHADRRPSDERKRMDYVNNELDIDDDHWIRFNPDEENFDISSVIGKILAVMKMKGVWKPTYKPPTKAYKNINLDPEKPCNMCNIVKPLCEFNNASDHRDGKENVCTICRRNRQKEILIEKKNMLGDVTEIECNVCKKTLGVDKFYRDNNSPTGRMRKCKICHTNKIKLGEKKEKIRIAEKKCTTCKEVKSVVDFHKRMASRDGYNIYCKLCSLEKSKIFALNKKKKNKENS